MPNLVVKVIEDYGYYVDRALVTVRAGNFKRTARTDLWRGAVFENLEPGDYEITVRQPYLPYIPYRGSVALGDEDKEIEVRLLRPIEIAVRDPNGSPINNATVRMIVITTSYDQIYDSLNVVRTDHKQETVNEEGKIWLLPLSAGTHVRIEVRAPGYKGSDITIPFFINNERLTFNITLEPEG